MGPLALLLPNDCIHASFIPDKKHREALAAMVDQETLKLIVCRSLGRQTANIPQKEIDPNCE
jgi:hypothetical protein